ncbi:MULTISPECIES: hypothetical protein [unclassified Ekhidna]|jgi:glycyl-tRNA synthetase beta subunit|uniref:hypothetical protein n=1 Tax=unclassified Ekhidna TaxID=2632188 RepID=UPI0032DE4E89
MADSKTWIDVADTAVKIGLGALIGGLTGVWLARINNRHSTTTSDKENKRRILEEILELTDSFSQSVTTFWANRINAAWKIKKGEKLKKEEKEELSTQEKKLFNGFTIINTCRSKLLLIGAKEAEKKLSEYRKPIDEFFKISAIDNKDCTYEKLLPFKENISKSRRAFYESLNSEYEK